jgi:hypothetical protein
MLSKITVLYLDDIKIPEVDGRIGNCAFGSNFLFELVETENVLIEILVKGYFNCINTNFKLKLIFLWYRVIFIQNLTRLSDISKN